MFRAKAAFWILLTLLLVRFYGRYGGNSLQISFLDVGQGDAALVVLPGGKSFLLDAGIRSARTDRGREVVIPALAARGILDLEAVVLSHPDADHLGGLLAVLESLRVRAFWLPRHFLPPKRLQLKETLEVASRRGVYVFPWVVPSRFVLSSGVQWWVGLGKGESDNDHSLLVRLAYGPCSVLFTGDIGAQTERGLTDWGRSTVLKVSHHGSRFSSDSAFLKRVRPRLAVVSAGANNRYGHPHPDTLERLREVGTEILRTDFHGRVDISFDRAGRFACRSALGACGAGYCSEAKPN